MIALRTFVFGLKGANRELILKEYELEFAKVTGCRFSWSFASARMGLFTALKALGVGADDEVIIPAFSCVVVPNAILYTGATPVYADISFSDFNLIFEDVLKKITPKTKAIYVQHTFGHLVDIKPFRQLATDRGLYLIEDCAHVLGVKSSDGEIVGSLGDLAIFSTDHSKVISTGYGGMLTAKAPAVAEKVNALYAKMPELPQRMTKKILFVFLLEYLVHNPWFYRALRYVKSACGRLGLIQVFVEELVTDKNQLAYYPAKLSPELAQIGLLQLKALSKNLYARSQIVKEVSETLKIPSSEVPLLRISFLVQDREYFETLLKSNYDLGVWFTSIMQGREDHWEEIHYKLGSCPNAEYIAAHIVNVPTHQRISGAHLCYILQKVRALNLMLNKAGNAER